jgi:iron complex transport system substrate-binding protein
MKMIQISLFLLILIATQAFANDRRIISTDAGSTEIILKLGFGQDLVAVDITSQVPEDLEVARLGYHRRLSAEGILSMSPDLIIGSEHMGPPATVDLIRSSTIELLQLPAAQDLTSLKHNIDSIAQRLKAKDAAHQLLVQINALSSSLDGNRFDDSTKIVFLLVMDGKSLRMAGTHTTGDTLIHLLGGQNMADFSGYKTITAEALLGEQPDIILLSGRDDKNQTVNTLLKTYPFIASTPAGRHQRIISVDGRNLVAGLSINALVELEDISRRLRSDDN